jgi:plasmid stabilization system protein ParE
MGYEIVWADPAASQLEEIRDYIAEQNPRAATKMVQQIFDCVEVLEEPRVSAPFSATAASTLFEN